MRAPEASMSRLSKPGRKVLDGLALPFPSVRASSGFMGVGEVLDVRLATSGVLPRHLIGALLMRTQRSAREPGFIVSTQPGPAISRKVEARVATAQHAD